VYNQPEKAKRKNPPPPEQIRTKHPQKKTFPPTKGKMFFLSGNTEKTEPRENDGEVLASHLSGTQNPEKEGKTPLKNKGPGQFQAHPNPTLT